jgi:hydrogenase-4 component B
MFFLMAHTAGSMNFDVIGRTSFPPVLAGTIFLLAVIGFGVKAGFIPLHIWLPHAHPAAPSHISALLSGIAIKTGIYGICRVLWMMGVLPDWCGYALLGIGVVSGIMGVLYALGQHELKKLLAYHSIENIGIIALGLGLGLLGRSHQMPFLTVVGFSGALLHVFNHSLFKGLLFLDAGAVIQKTHTGEMDQLGGLSKTMPATSVLFMIGALSICGLPLFNGFISEFIIYFGLFHGLLNLPLSGVVACAVGILSLALMGALALACFSKVYGTVFSGEPRVPERVVEAQDPSLLMMVPMSVLAGLCVWIGLSPQTMVRFTFRGGECLTRLDPSGVSLEKVLTPLSAIVAVAFMFLVVVAVLIILRQALLGPSPVPVRETWSCGFAQVSPKFQYTSSSFARPIIDFVKGSLLLRRHGGQVSGELPGKAHLSSSVHDASQEFMLQPIFAWLAGLSKKIDDNRIRYTQIYLMYIFLFLIFLLIWKLR